MLKRFLLSIVVSTLGLFALLKVALLYSADIYIKESKENLIAGEYETAREKSEKAIQTNPKEPSYYRQHVKSILAITTTSPGKQAALKNEALSALNTAVQINPNNLSTIRNSIPLYYYLTLKTISAGSTKRNIDADYLLVAEKFFEQVATTYQTDAGVLIDIAHYQKKLFLTEDFTQTKENIKKLRQDLVEWHEYLR